MNTEQRIAWAQRRADQARLMSRFRTQEQDRMPKGKKKAIDKARQEGEQYSLEAFAFDLLIANLKQQTPVAMVRETEGGGRDDG